MLMLGGEFGRVRLGGGPQGRGVYWVDDACQWNEFDPAQPNGPRNQNFDGSIRYRRIAYGIMRMVRVEFHSETNHVDIRWNVRTVSPDALDAVSDYLYDVCRQFSVHLHFFIDGWCGERYEDARPAIERIQHLLKFYAIPLVDSFFMKSMDVDRGANMTRLIQQGLDIFRKTKGVLSTSDFEALMPYLLVYKPDAADGHLMIENAGHKSANAKVYGVSWAEQANGTLYDRETPGAYYSQRTSEAYSGVMESDEPRFDHIRAVIDRPDDEAMWASYQRLLFRGYLKNGAPVLVCLCDLTQDIDIPFLSV